MCLPLSCFYPACILFKMLTHLHSFFLLFDVCFKLIQLTWDLRSKFDLKHFLFHGLWNTMPISILGGYCYIGLIFHMTLKSSTIISGNTYSFNFIFNNREYIVSLKSTILPHIYRSKLIGLEKVGEKWRSRRFPN